MVRNFIESDLEIVNHWLHRRGQAPITLDLVPKHGLIAPNAVGFIYQTDASVAILDMFVTNKDAPLKDRTTDLEEIATSLISGSNNRLIMATTKHPAILRLLKLNNFIQLDHTCHIRGISNENYK